MAQIEIREVLTHGFSSANFAINSERINLPLPLLFTHRYNLCQKCEGPDIYAPCSVSVHDEGAGLLPASTA